MGRSILDGDDDIGAQKREAYHRLSAAWEEALTDGIEPEVLAQVALFAAFRDLVDTYGETAVADFANGLADRIVAGEFTLPAALH